MPRTGSDPPFAEVGSYTINPEGEVFPSSQVAQTAVGLYENVLRHILSIMEVAELGVYKRKDAGFVFIHEDAESLWLTVETLADYASIFRLHFILLKNPLTI
jgi:hypothetical protein